MLRFIEQVVHRAGDDCCIPHNASVDRDMPINVTGIDVNVNDSLSS